MAPTGGDLLAAWERAATLPPADRALSLLQIYDPGSEVETLSVGQADALLFRLRRQLFGDALDAEVNCPSCGERVSTSLSLIDVSPPLQDVPTDIQTIAGPHRLRLRPVTNADLSALTALGPGVTERDVVGRCLITAVDDTGQLLTIDELPDEILAAALHDLWTADPGANVVLGITCVCGAEWADVLEIRTLVWTDVEDWATNLLHEIHVLASTYGWAESDILEMSAWRRAWYREAIGW
jgi:hypothetical protein